MSPVTVIVAGRHLGVIETVSTAGELAGIPYSSRWRTARAQSWPLVGEPGSQRVLMVPFCELLGIPYQIEEDR